MQTKFVDKMIKLKELLKENDESWYSDKNKLTTEQKKILFNELKSLSERSNIIYHDGDLNEFSKRLHAISDYAKRYIDEAMSDNFDKITVNRNLRELDKHLNSFKKTAKKTQKQRNRLTALYEEIALILNRYFDIGDAKQLNE